MDAPKIFNIKRTGKWFKDFPIPPELFAILKQNLAYSKKQFMYITIASEMKIAVALSETRENIPPKLKTCWRKKMALRLYKMINF